MSEHSERDGFSPADDRDAADDDRLRRLLSLRPGAEPSPGIEARVISRVSRRRFLSRAAGTTLSTAAAVGVGVACYHFLDPDQQPIAGRPVPEIPGSDLEEVQVAALSEPPPVAEFRLLAQDQNAILECLVSLEEEGI